MEDPGPSIILFGTALCMVVLAFTSAAEAAFTTISRHRLNMLLSDGTPRAQALARLIDDPYHLRATLLMLNAGATIVATAFVLRLTIGMEPWLQVASFGLLLLVILILGSAVPKTIASRNAEQTAAAIIRPLSMIARVFWPLIAFVNLLTRPLLRLFGDKNPPPSALVTEEEIRLLVNVGEEEGLIEHNERQMIEGVFSFGDTLVREVMVPRVDIFAIELETPFEQAVRMAIAENHSRVPVYKETLDTIVGILYIKDLLPLLVSGSYDTSIRDLLRKPHFVPETTKVDALLKDMQKRRVHMALIVDEYGGTAGLATIEDLLEEIVGEIQDEYDEEEPSIQVVSEYELLVDSRVLIDEINELTGLELAAADADRIGGLVYEQLGRVPKVGDLVEVDGTTIEVLSMKGMRPVHLRISYPRAIEASVNGAHGPGGEASAPT